MTITSPPQVASGLTAGPTGRVVRPGDLEWDRARTPWVVNVDQRPSAVTLVASTADVVDSVRSARASGLRVTAQGTGHGSPGVGSLADTVLVRTAGLRHVQVDPESRTAWVGAGAEWQAVTGAAAEHGLAALAGSSPDVGVAGYLLSGGISWLGRSHGLAVNDILAVQIVTADGELRVVDAGHDPDLFWAVRGGGGSFGVVTAFRLRLHRLQAVTAGTLFFPMEQAQQVLTVWRDWIRTVPEQTMSCGRLLQFPPFPEIPEPLRGRAFVVVEVAHVGEMSELAPMLEPLRACGPVLDTVAPCPPVGLAALHMDPPGPTPGTGDGMLLTDLPNEAIDAVVACAGAGSGSPLLSVEFRHLGGAIARRPDGAGAVGHFDAQFAFFAVGVTPDPATTAKVADRITVVEEALAPWSAPLHYANFSERSGGRDRFHDRETMERLRMVKAAYDPTALFFGAHADLGS
jgi:hypothetical protein